MKNVNNISMHGEKFYHLHTETTTAVATSVYEIWPENASFRNREIPAIGLLLFCTGPIFSGYASEVSQIKVNLGKK